MGRIDKMLDDFIKTIATETQNIYKTAYDIGYKDGVIKGKRLAWKEVKEILAERKDKNL
jgi:hypothetical protein